MKVKGLKDNQDNRTELANMFKRLRKMGQLTQADVGCILGIGRTSITNMERGNQPVLLEYIEKLANHQGYQIVISLEQIEHISKATRERDDDIGRI